MTEWHTLYEVPLGSLTLNVAGIPVDVTDTLTNGRSSYILFQKLAGTLAGYTPGSEGGGSDLQSDQGGVEVKAYPDATDHTGARDDLIHTAASATFGANNLGPTVTDLVTSGQYKEALRICRETGYAKNNAYLYTNTRKLQPGTPLRFIVVPTTWVIANLDKTDPRILSRATLLGSVKKHKRVNGKDVRNAFGQAQ